MTTPFLKPCPFCGEPIGEENIYAAKDTWHVACPKCRTRGPACNTGEEAVAAWNERKQPMGEWEAGLDICSTNCSSLTIRLSPTLKKALKTATYQGEFGTLSEFVDNALRVRIDELGIPMPNEFKSQTQPCQNCGYQRAYFVNDGRGITHLECPKCGNKGPMARSLIHAISAWNSSNKEDAE